MPCHVSILFGFDTTICVKPTTPLSVLTPPPPETLSRYPPQALNPDPPKHPGYDANGNWLSTEKSCAPRPDFGQ